MAIPFCLTVKSGETFRSRIPDGKMIVITQASLSEPEIKIERNEEVRLYIKVNKEDGDGKEELVLGTLGTVNRPQIALDFLQHDYFEISHTWKGGSVHFFAIVTLDWPRLCNVPLRANA